MSIIASALGVSLATGTGVVDRLVERVDMADLADRRCDGFSHGETVKVALARALVHDPPNVVLDEPTAGLDVMSTRAVRALVRELRDQGRAVLFSSHVMQEVSALCDEIVIIADGRLVARGTPDEIRAQTGRDDLEDAFVKVIGSADLVLLDDQSMVGDRFDLVPAAVPFRVVRPYPDLPMEFLTPMCLRLQTSHQILIQIPQDCLIYKAR